MSDLRLAIRALRATPIFSIVAVLSLALGIGANTAIFSLVNRLLLRALPVSEPERLVTISSADVDTKQRLAGWTFATWDNIRQRASMFDGAFAWSGPNSWRLTDRDGVQSADGLFASGDFFSTLGVRAIAGRTFSATDDAPGGGKEAPVAVLGYGFWQRKFGGAPEAVGSTLAIEGVPFTVIGVAPPNFFGVEVGSTFDIVVPLATEPLIRGKNSLMNDALVAMWLRIMARLGPGQTIETATTALRAAQPAIREAAMPQSFPKIREEFLKGPFSLPPAAAGTSQLRQQYARPLLTLFIVVALVLLVACANIANLLLARATMRRHELSVRRALGAPRWRLARQLLVESLLLASAGAAVGLMFAAWGSRALVAALPGGRSISLDVSIDWRVLAFAAAATIGTALLFGTAPAFQAAGAAPIDALKAQGRGSSPDGGARQRLSQGLVVTQVALSLMLVFAAGLFVQTFVRLASVPLGFDRQRTLAVSIDASRARVDDDDRVALYQQLTDAAAATPGVERAAGSMFAPFVGGGGVVDVPNLEAVPERERRSPFNVVTPRWFATYGLTLRAGRDFDSRDTRQAATVVIVNEAFARRFLPGPGSGPGPGPERSAIGETVALSLGGQAMSTRTIVGVVSDAVQGSLRSDPPPTLYLPLAQWDFPVPMLPRFLVNIRASAGSPAQLSRSVTAAMTMVNRDLRLTPRVVADEVDASFAQERLIATLAGFFGGLALLLAALGLYGVTAYAVSRRRQEIGIRIGLGAKPADVVRLVLRRVSWLVCGGILIGGGASLWLSRFVAPLLFGLQPRDPFTLAAAALTLAAVGALAGWIPAALAARIDPAEALRQT